MGKTESRTMNAYMMDQEGEEDSSESPDLDLSE